MASVNASAKPASSGELPEVMTVAVAASWLGVDVKTIYTAIEEGRFPARRIGRRRIVILRDALIEWMKTGEGSDN
ncbi:MAG: helix-turn-helix domain-containing protein [Polyangiaceae bacterium]|nr:helix-turn-helix domain-containing protein [Polyangiaceae bacterium]